MTIKNNVYLSLLFLSGFGNVGFSQNLDNFYKFGIMHHRAMVFSRDYVPIGTDVRELRRPGWYFEYTWVKQLRWPQYVLESSTFYGRHASFIEVQIPDNFVPGYGASRPFSQFKFPFVFTGYRAILKKRWQFQKNQVHGGIGFRAMAVRPPVLFRRGYRITVGDNTVGGNNRNLIFNAKERQLRLRNFVSGAIDLEMDARIGLPKDRRLIITLWLSLSPDKPTKIDYIFNGAKETLKGSFVRPFQYLGLSFSFIPKPKSPKPKIKQEYDVF